MRNEVDSKFANGPRVCGAGRTLVDIRHQLGVGAMAAKNAPTYVLAEKGPVLVYHASQPSIGLLNANPFRMGIANLGSQMIADSLLKAGFNVEFGFADTDVGSGPFVAGFTSPTDCPVLAISVPFEDTYHHVPRMLRSCGLRTRASERSQEDPVVVAGGMALINPMPLSPFVDVVVLSEGRETLVEICRAVVHARQVGIRKPDILRELAGIAHVYVPSLYQFMFDRFGGVTSMKVDPAAPGAVSPARTLDMTQNPISSIWTTPRACYEHNDYFSMMVAMGCHKKCPFCVVGSTQGEQSGRALNIGPSAILDLAERRRSQWGTRLIKLFFASSFSEVASIDPLDLRELLEMMLARDFSVRVGSLNVRQADDRLLEVLKALGQKRVPSRRRQGLVCALA